jgi:hypothetical protein
VRDAARMMASGRRVAGETVTAMNVVRMPSRWKRWIPAAAAAGLLMVNGGLLFMQRTVPVMETAAVSTKTIGGASRSQDGEEPPTIPAGKPAIQIAEILSEAKYPNYEIQVRNSAHHVMQTFRVSAEQAKDPIALLLRPLPAGSYSVVIEGVDAGNHRTNVTESAIRVQ